MPRGKRERQPRCLPEPSLFWTVTLDAVIQWLGDLVGPGSSLTAAHHRELGHIITRLRRLRRQVQRYPAPTHFPPGQGPDGLLADPAERHA